MLANHSAVVGYEIDENVSWLTIIEHDNRSVVRLSTPQVLSRTVCNSGGYTTPPPIANMVIVGGFGTYPIRQHYPEC